MTFLVQFLRTFGGVFYAKSVGFWGSAPDPGGGASSAPPHPLAGREGCPPPAPSPSWPRLLLRPTPCHTLAGAPPPLPIPGSATADGHGQREISLWRTRSRLSAVTLLPSNLCDLLPCACSQPHPALLQRSRKINEFELLNSAKPLFVRIKITNANLNTNAIARMAISTMRQSNFWKVD